MSHFSLCAVIPGEQIDKINRKAVEAALETRMIPFCEDLEISNNGTFHDQTDEARADYESNADYQMQYPTFEDFCRKYHGYKQDSHNRWGYYYNDAATWDWYEIGGRFPGQFLTVSGNEDVLRMSEADEAKHPAPEGYRYVNAVRMKDIAWEKAFELSVARKKEEYAKLVKAFATGDISDVDSLATISEKGIHIWGNTLYLKGESEEDYLARTGGTSADFMPIDVYAILTRDGEWTAHGTMGWWGISTNEKPDRSWYDEIAALAKEIQPDDVLVAVDCHI